MTGFIPDSAPATTSHRFNIVVPITKSERDPISGKLKVKGIATDHKQDLDGEVVKASESPMSLDYLQECGVFNWDHTDDIIGKVEKARLVNRDEAEQEYGKKFVGTPIEIEGTINDIQDLPEMLIPKGLKKVHYLAHSEHPLYFSIQGTVAQRKMEKGADGKMVQVAYPAIINQVAITAQPKNSNSVCTIVKSFNDLLVDPEASTETETLPVLQIMCSPLEEVIKSIPEGTMGTTGIVPQGGTTGADAIKSDGLSNTFPGTDGKKRPDPVALMQKDEQDGNGGVQSITKALVSLDNLKKLCESVKKCNHCHKPTFTEYAFCPICGTAFEDAKPGDPKTSEKTIEKSLSDEILELAGLDIASQIRALA